MIWAILDEKIGTEPSACMRYWLAIFMICLTSIRHGGSSVARHSFIMVIQHIISLLSLSQRSSVLILLLKRVDSSLQFVMIFPENHAKLDVDNLICPGLLTFGTAGAIFFLLNYSKN